MNRYQHQIVLPPIGEEGQKILAEKRILIIGCGALGSVSANNLVRLGIGQITVLDRDYVEFADLNRQILFYEEDARRRLPKAIVAASRLRKINSQVKIEGRIIDLNHSNVDTIISDYDLVLDGTDNIETRFLINTVCIKKGIPWIYAGSIGSSAILMNIFLDGPCLQCLIPKLPEPGRLETCATRGVINSAPAVVASIQTTEAIKILIGDSNVLRDVLYIDLWSNEFRRLKIKKRTDCPICIRGNFEINQPEVTPTTWCERNGFQIQMSVSKDLDLNLLNERFRRLTNTIINNYLISFKIDGYEITLFRDGRAIIKGVSNEKEARAIYTRYVGM